ncbi:MAG TPA: hypothetical protein P5216_04455, partial [Bacteroidota bacterium]|nr:hypothetical protein [Bacteroidota bacterium]
MFQQSEINQEAKNSTVEYHKNGSQQELKSNAFTMKIKFWFLFIRLKIIKLLKDILNYMPGRKHFFFKYSFLFEPPQLAYLGSCIYETKDVEGSI